MLLNPEKVGATAMVQNKKLSASVVAAPYKTPAFESNIGASKRSRPQAVTSPKHLLVISDFDHTLTRNDCGAEVAGLAGISNADFFSLAKDTAKSGRSISKGGEFADLVVHHSAFRSVDNTTFLTAAKKVSLKDNMCLFIDAMKQGIDGYQVSFFVVSAGPQETVREALAPVGMPRENVIGTRFNFFENGERTLVHASAGEGKVEIIKDLLNFHQLKEANVLYLGDGSSDIEAMKYLQKRGGYNVAVEDSEALRPFRSTLLVSRDASAFLQPVRKRIAELKAAPILCSIEQPMLVNKGDLVQKQAA